jgi:nicotinate-nucleotide--dimethylbenzimidazole phosphoribosyltransferase
LAGHLEMEVTKLLRAIEPLPSVANFASGGAAINQIAESVGAEIVLVDVGVAHDLGRIEGVRHEKICWGTADMSVAPAMSREECSRAILVGARIAAELSEAGVELIGTGEMGIANSTAAAALTSAMTGASPDEVVGRGTGLDDAGLRHKV